MTRALAVVVALVALSGLAGACAVPELSLEGKQCPCVGDGYVCDTLTNRCLKTNDGGTIIDSPSATSCLPGGGGGVELYRYASTFDWQHADPGWGGAAEITQTSTNAQDSYAYKTSAELTAAADYHVISSMRQVSLGSGTPAFGIALRAQLDQQDKARYACLWSSKQRELRIRVMDAGNMPPLATATVSGSDPLPTSFTMEASVTGFSFACCIREIADARIVNAVDITMKQASGYPGLQTDRMAAAFGSFVVVKPN